MQRDYSDIINLPHHQSSARKRMSMLDRAAQFAPFAALTGYEAAIKETARTTEKKSELDEEALIELNRRTLILQGNINAKPLISVKYFIADKKKQGGEYAIYEGNIRKIDNLQHVLVFDDGTRLAMDCVVRIDGEIFKDANDF